VGQDGRVGEQDVARAEFRGVGPARQGGEGEEFAGRLPVLLQDIAINHDRVDAYPAWVVPEPAGEVGGGDSAGEDEQLTRARAGPRGGDGTRDLGDVRRR
jgi:hypothetical protein